jgi:adenylate kinase
MNFLGITGSPGTGKKTVSPVVASSLSFPLVDLNAVARAKSRVGSTIDVDTRTLRKMLLGTTASEGVVFGHLLPHVYHKGEIDFVAVLRCEPSVLKKRLINRGYTNEKLIENLEAELIGVVLDESIRTFGEAAVHEYDSTKTNPIRLASSIVTDYKRGGRSSADWTDWTARYASSARLRSLLSFGSTDVAST